MRDRKALLGTRAAGFALAAAVLTLASACASIPAGKTAADWLGALPADSSYFLCLNVGRTRELAKTALRQTPLASPDIEQLLDFTEWIYGGVKINPGDKPALSVLALGNYPFVIKSVFDSSAELEKVPGDPPSWRHKKFGLQIALPMDFMVAASKDDVAGLARAAQTGVAVSGVSSDAAREIAANDLTLYFPLGWDDLVSADTGLTLPKKIFREIWLSARQREDRFYFEGVFTVGPDVDTQSFKRLLQFFMLALFRKNDLPGLGARLTDVKFSVQDRMIKATGFYFTRAELEPLIVGLLAKGI